MSFIKNFFGDKHTRISANNSLVVWSVSSTSDLRIERYRSKKSEETSYHWYIASKSDDSRVPLLIQDIQKLILVLYQVAKVSVVLQEDDTDAKVLEEAMVYALEEAMENAQERINIFRIEQASQIAEEDKQEALQELSEQIYSLIEGAGGLLTLEKAEATNKVINNLLEGAATKEAVNMLWAKRQQEVKQQIENLIQTTGGTLAPENEKTLNEIVNETIFLNYADAFVSKMEKLIQ